MPLTNKQREQAKGIVSDMVDAGFNENEISDTLKSNGLYEGPQFTMDKPLSEQAKEFSYSMAPVALTMLGGATIPAAVEKFAPEITQAISRPAVSGMSQALGNLLGSIPDIARGKLSVKDALINSGFVGSGGMLAEGSANLATRGLASMGGVQAPAVDEALSKGTGARTVFGKPAVTAEANLGRQISDSLKPSNTGLTPGRVATEAQLSKLAEQQQTVDLTPTLDELNARIHKLQSKGVGSDANAAISRLTKIRADISSKYLAQGPNPNAPPKIAVSPQDADLINQQLQDAIGNAYNKPGAKQAIRELKGVQKVHTAQFRQQTMTQESAAATTQRLNDIETMRKQVSQVTPESFVRGVGDAIMTHGESGDQSALIALRNFDRTGKLEAQIKSLAAQREWTGSQSRIAHNIKWEFVRRLPRFAAKVTTVAARPVGVAAGAATAAFQQAMNPMNNP